MKFSNFVLINPKIKLQRQKEYPFISMSDVNPGQRYVKTNEKKIYKGGGSRFKNSDILFARITPCLENGKISQFISDDEEHGFGSTEFIVFRNKPNISDLNFIFYIAISDLIRKPAEKSMYGASGRQRVDIDVFNNVEIPDFDLITQRKIAHILSKFDDLFEINLRRIRILEELSQSLYNEWFVHLQFPGHEDMEIIQTEHGSTPKGWKHVKLGELAPEIRRPA